MLMRVFLDWQTGWLVQQVPCTTPTTLSIRLKYRLNGTRPLEVNDDRAPFLPADPLREHHHPSLIPRAIHTTVK